MTERPLTATTTAPARSDAGATTGPDPRRRSALDRPAALVALWLASGALLMTALGTPHVVRTQEARVLETAREMVGPGAARQWLFPQVNGRPRMKKPPLAYWLTAASYRAFGVGEGPGRVPAALAGWLTVGLTIHLARRLFGGRAAFFAGAALLGSALFFRHARLAETDVLAMLFATAGTYAVWRGCDAWPARDGADVPPTGTPTTLAAAKWFHAAAVSTALAALSKGPPAAYPALFLIVWSASTGRWRNLWRFVACGAPLTFLGVAVPWFALTASDPSSQQLVRDLDNSVTGGRGPWEWPHVYLHQLATGAAPWTGVLALALGAAASRWRSDWRLRGILVWVAVVLVPLCLWGNKQRHYLLTALPPLMVLVGWLVDLALRSAREDWIARAARTVAVGTFIGCALVIPGVLVAGRMVRGHVTSVDVGMAAGVTALLAGVWMVRRRGGASAGAATFALGNGLVLLAVFIWWAPTLRPVTSRTVADAVRARYGYAPLVFVRREDLPLVYHLRQVVPIARTEAELAALAAREPGLIAIEVRNDGRAPFTGLLVEELRFDDGEDTAYLVGPVTAGVQVPAEPVPAAAVR
jgi:4-amino-4-deoxy-L-arabinose transferase-like glycosyltransferase